MNASMQVLDIAIEVLLVFRPRQTIYARCVLCWPAFPLASALGSTGSAADRSALFVGFTATMAESDFLPPCFIGYGSSPSRCGPLRQYAGGRR